MEKVHECTRTCKLKHDCPSLLITVSMVDLEEVPLGDEIQRHCTIMPPMTNKNEMKLFMYNVRIYLVVLFGNR